jgi:hypothetical protein
MIRSRRTQLLGTAGLVYGLTFVGAALLNWGVRVQLGFAELSFSPRVWQAGVGEAVIGLSVLAAALSGGPRLGWAAWSMSAAGIAFGLASPKVQGAARNIHVILVPLAFVVLVLLLRERRTRDESASHTAAVGR